MTLRFDTTGLGQESYAAFIVGVLATLVQLGIDFDYDEVPPDLSYYSVITTEP